MQNAASSTRLKIQRFTDLRVWQEGHKLVVWLYKITEMFPKVEVFGLTNQMRRAAVSVTSNIAEGFGRRSEKDKVRFYDTAQASLAELQSQLLVAKDVNILAEDDFKNLMDQSEIVDKLLTGLIKSIQGTWV